MKDRYQGKRFAAFLLTIAALVGGLPLADPSVYSAFSMAVGLAFGAYVTGQSTTDYKTLHVKQQNGGG